MGLTGCGDEGDQVNTAHNKPVAAVYHIPVQCSVVSFSVEAPKSFFTLMRIYAMRGMLSVHVVLGLALIITVSPCLCAEQTSPKEESK